MQAHLYLGETFLRANSQARSLSEFERAFNFADRLGTSEEKWKSLYGLGRVEQQSGNLGVAESYYRQSIATIEKSRSQLQLTALRTDFFADKRDVYDRLIARLLQNKNIPDAFEMLERSRAISFRDRLELRNPQLDTATLTLAQAQAVLDPGTVFLEYWAAPHQIGLIWCTKQKYGMVLRETGPADEASIHALLENIPASLVHPSQEQTTLLSNLFPAESALPQDIRHILIVPDGVGSVFYLSTFYVFEVLLNRF